MKIPKLLELRKKLHLTQKEIAEKFHISQRAYSHYEKGTRELPIEYLIKLADYYNVSTDYILGHKPVNKEKHP